MTGVMVLNRGQQPKLGPHQSHFFAVARNVKVFWLTATATAILNHDRSLWCNVVESKYGG